jgi:subtilisin family serine protease
VHRASRLYLGDAVEDAVDAAHTMQGLLVIAAAGNDGGAGDDGDVASPGIVEYRNLCRRS